MIGDLVNNAGSMLDSAYDFASTAVTYAGQEKQRQENRDLLFRSNQDVLRTQYTDGLRGMLEGLPESIDFDKYGERVQEYNEEFISTAQSSGSYDERTLSWLENEFIPSQRAQTEKAVEGVSDYATYVWVANNANNKANAIAADPSLNVDDAYEQYRTYYSDVGLGSIPNGKTVYGYLDPEEFRETIRGTKALQSFERMARDPDKGYANLSFDKDASMKTAASEAGYVFGSETERKSFVEQCEKIISEIDGEFRSEAADAQNRIVSDFYLRYRNGEQYTASDIIDAAEQMGAISNGQINRYWATFLGPYIEYEVAQKQISDAILAAGKDVDGLTIDTVKDVVGRVNDGSFRFSPSTSGQATSASGVSSSGSVKVSTGIPIPAGAAPSRMPGQSQTEEPKSQAPEGFLVDNAEGMSWMETPRRTAQSEGVTYLDDYSPYDDGGKATLSGSVRSEVEKASAAQGSLFEDLFGTDGNINYTRLSGKETYSCEGYPDIDSSYEPVVMALCQELQVPYTKGSLQVYQVAEMVQQMAEGGAFTNPDKMKTVQQLAVARINPAETEQSYNTKLMQAKSTGVLTDDEIDMYGLDSFAFAGDLSDTTYQDSVNYAYRVMFRNLYGKVYSTSAVNKLKDDKYSQWQRLAQEVSQELQIAYQTDPQGMAANANAKVDEIVQKVSDDSFSKELYALCTGKPSYDVYAGNPYINSGTLRSLYETADGEHLLADYFSSGANAEYLNPEMVDFITGNYMGDSSDLDTSRKEARKQIDELAERFYGSKYSDCSVSQRNTLAFSYFYGRTSNELTKRTCARFGYDIGEVYGNVVVEPTLGYGGGMAVVTKDGRVFMSGGTPDGSGHMWVIGAVSSQTLSNIAHGVVTISYGEISANGVYNFSDANTDFDKAGRSMVSNSSRGKDKEYELVGIYESIQPDRYNLRQL